MPKNARGFHEYNEAEPVAATASGMLNKQTEALTARDTPQVVDITTLINPAANWTIEGGTLTRTGPLRMLRIQAKYANPAGGSSLSRNAGTGRITGQQLATLTLAADLPLHDIGLYSNPAAGRACSGRITGPAAGTPGMISLLGVEGTNAVGVGDVFELHATYLAQGVIVP